MSVLDDEELEFSRGCLALSRSFVWGKQRDDDDAIWFENFGGSSLDFERTPPRLQISTPKRAHCVLDIDGEPISAPLLSLREVDPDLRSRDSTTTQTVSSSVDDTSPPSSHSYLVRQSSITSSSRPSPTSRFRRRWGLRRRYHCQQQDYHYQRNWRRTSTFISCFGLQPDRYR